MGGIGKPVLAALVYPVLTVEFKKYGSDGYKKEDRQAGYCGKRGIGSVNTLVRAGIFLRTGKDYTSTKAKPRYRRVSLQF